MTSNSKPRPTGNRRPHRVPAQHWPDIKAAIATLKALLEPHLPVVDPKRRRTMPKMGAEGRAFARKCAAYGRTHPQFLPAVIDIDEFDRDLQDVKDLEGVAELLDQLHYLVTGAALHYRAQVMTKSHSFYGSVQGATRLGIPHSQPIRDDLGRHILGGQPRKRRSSDQDGSL